MWKAKDSKFNPKWNKNQLNSKFNRIKNSKKQNNRPYKSSVRLNKLPNKNNRPEIKEKKNFNKFYKQTENKYKS